MYRLETFNAAGHTQRIMGMKLREEDRREFETSSGVTGNAPVLSSAINSEDCVVIVDRATGRINALWGVVSFPHFGAVWGCGTDECMSVIAQLTDDVRPYLDKWQEKHGTIGGCIDSRNTKHVRWLRQLGFTIYENTSFVRGVPFHFFRRSYV